MRCALFLLLGSVVLSLGGAFLLDLAVVADAVDDPDEHVNDNERICGCAWSGFRSHHTCSYGAASSTYARC